MRNAALGVLAFGLLTGCGTEAAVSEAAPPPAAASACKEPQENTTVAGQIQYVTPCPRPAFVQGCLRLVAGSDAFYIDRYGYVPADEFHLVKAADAADPAEFDLNYGSQRVRLHQDQQVRLRARLAEGNTRIVSISRVDALSE